MTGLWEAMAERFTERDWLDAVNPISPLYFVTAELNLSQRKLRASNRKLRLFGCACCRRIWPLLSHEWAKESVLIAEAYSDGLAGNAELLAAFRKAPESLLRLGGWDVYSVSRAADATEEERPTWALIAARDVSALDGGVKEAEMPRQMSRACCPDTYDAAESAAQALLLRDVIGNPFRPPSPLPPAMLNWNDATVPRIAQAIYEDRRMPEGTLDNSRLAILADALLDAGCDDEDLIQHCRQPGPHVRGCWAVDLILGKE